MAVDVLVTGAAGVLGRKIVGVLRESGYIVAACGRVAGNYVDAEWDISRQTAPNPDCRARVVVHAAALMGNYRQPVSEALQPFEANVCGTLRVVNWCLAQDVQHVILISGAIVYGEWTGSPKTESDPVQPWQAGPYAVSKYCSEQAASLLLTEGRRLTILRFSSLYGPGYNRGLMQRFLRQAQETGGIHLEPPFDDAFDLLHVADAARTVLRAIEVDQGGLWNAGSGNLTTIMQVAQHCADYSQAHLTCSESLAERPARVLNWVDDGKARRELRHTNQVDLDSEIGAIALSLASIAPL